MKDAGIDEGDTLIVRQQPASENGDIAVAPPGDEATVKRFRRRPDGGVELRPENPEHKPIIIKRLPFMIQGKVVAVHRELMSSSAEDDVLG